MNIQNIPDILIYIQILCNNIIIYSILFSFSLFVKPTKTGFRARKKPSLCINFEIYADFLKNPLAIPERMC